MNDKERADLEKKRADHNAEQARRLKEVLKWVRRAIVFKTVDDIQEEVEWAISQSDIRYC